ncbi:helix-turn-helix domain-containing protein [Morganella sp. B601]|uniref:helix-turn-helix domain-containing protein n=1 Tax=Morganella sp. B601 TaxID=3444315 RepID=UPI003EBBD921
MTYNTKKHTGDKTRLSQNAGELIRNLRTIKGISGKEFGHIVGLSQQQVSRYETGRGRLTLELLWRFADAFDLTFWELIDMLHHSFIQE